MLHLGYFVIDPIASFNEYLVNDEKRDFMLIVVITPMLNASKES